MHKLNGSPIVCALACAHLFVNSCGGGGGEASELPDTEIQDVAIEDHDAVSNEPDSGEFLDSQTDVETAPDTAMITCAPWQVPSADGSCEAVGADCAEAARSGAECLLAACAPPERTTSDGRCEVVGPTICVLPDDTTACAPSPCPLGTLGVPAARTCEPVGITECGEDFVDGNGLCKPQKDACAPSELTLPWGCAPLWQGCGANPWAGVEVQQGDVFVSPGAQGGDGSLGSPLGSLAEALSAVVSGGRVIVGPGEWAEALHVVKDVTLLAPCGGETTLTKAGATSATTEGNDAGALSAAIWVEGAKVEVVGFRIAAPGLGVLASGGGKAALRECEVSGAVFAGVAALGPGAEVAVEHSRLMDFKMSLLGNRMAGMAAFADAGGAFFLRDVEVRRARTWAVQARGGASEGTVKRSSIIDTLSNDENLFGRAAQARAGGLLSLEQSWLAGGRDAGAYAFGGNLELLHCLVEDTLPLQGTPGGAYDGRFGGGVVCDSASNVVVRASIVQGNTGHGLAAYGGNTFLRAEGCLVRNTKPGFIDVLGDAGRGAEAAFGARIEILRSQLVNNREAGVFVNGAAASALIEESYIFGTSPGAAGGGDGILAIAGAQVAVKESVLIENTAAGVAALGKDTAVNVERSEISQTRIGDAGADGVGYGLVAQQGAKIDAQGISLRNNAAAGVYASGERTNVVLHNVLVRGTKSSGLGTYGRGLNIQQGASAELEGVTLEYNRDVALFAHLPGANLAVRDLLVRHTAAEEATDINGRGIEIQSGEASIHQVYVYGGADGALLVSGPTASVTVQDATLTGDGSQRGHGAIAQDGATLTLKGAWIVGGSESGAVAADGARLTIERTAVQGPAESERRNELPREGEFAGDGLLALHGSELRASRVHASGWPQAGVRWADSTGSLKASRSRANGYGVVLQQTTTPEVADDNRIENNAILDIWTDGALPVPPVPVPAKL